MPGFRLFREGRLIKIHPIGIHDEKLAGSDVVEDSSNDGGTGFGLMFSARGAVAHIVDNTTD